LQADRLPADDILEQSLRAADVLTTDYASSSLPVQFARTGTSLPVTSQSVTSVSQPPGTADCALDYSQQQRFARRRPHNDNNNNNSNNNNTVVIPGDRCSLSDVVTPTSDATSASSPSESFSQVRNYTNLSSRLVLLVIVGLFVVNELCNWLTMDAHVFLVSIQSVFEGSHI